MICFATQFLLCIAVLKAIETFIGYEIKTGIFPVIFSQLVNALLSMTGHIPSSGFPAWLRILIVTASFAGSAAMFSVPFKIFSRKMIYISFLMTVTNAFYESCLYALITDRDIRSSISAAVEAAVLVSLSVYLEKKDKAVVVRSFLNMISAKLYVFILIFLYVADFFLFTVVDPEYRSVSKFFLMPLVAGFLILSFYILKTSIKAKEEKQISYVLTKQLESQVEYYEKINVIRSEFRSFRHDFRNHMLCIRSLISENETEKAVQYINDIEQMCIGTEKKGFDTGNIVADILLSDKSEKAERLNSRIVFKGYVPTTGITNADICTIMANAIDNAVEACARDDSGSIKEITVESDFRQGYYFFRTVNPVFENLNISNPKHIKTSKDNSDYHGFGVANIIRTSEKYNGNTKVYVENGYFHLEVELLLDRSIR